MGWPSILPTISMSVSTTSWCLLNGLKHCVNSAKFPQLFRVAEVGSLSARAKMAVKIFVKRVFTIFAENGLFLRVFDPKEHFFCSKISKK